MSISQRIISVHPWFGIAVMAVVIGAVGKPGSLARTCAAHLGFQWLFEQDVPAK